MTSEENVYLYQILKLQEEDLENQVNDLTRELGELFVTDNCFDELKKSKKGIFPSLGGGVFLLNEKNVLVDVGAGIFIKKSLEDAKNIIELRRKNIGRALNEVNKRLYDIKKKISELGEKLEKELASQKYK